MPRHSEVVVPGRPHDARQKPQSIGPAGVVEASVLHFLGEKLSLSNNVLNRVLQRLARQLKLGFFRKNIPIGHGMPRHNSPHRARAILA